MRAVVPIFRKEFGTYFVSPIAYIVIAIFLVSVMAMQRRRARAGSDAGKGMV